MRTLIADVTVLPETDRAKIRVGIRWHTGATDEITADRPQPSIGPAVATPTAAVELICILGPTTSNDDLVTTLNEAGHRTGRGRPFDIDAVRWVRHVHHIPTTGPLAPGEVSVAEAADRLGITADAVYYWNCRASCSGDRSVPTTITPPMSKAPACTAERPCRTSRAAPDKIVQPKL